MLVFLDFEASSLAKRSYPIEIAWVFEDGQSECHLIRPAPDWTDWDEEAEAVHHISRDMLAREGKSHDFVARRMIEALDGHDLLASAPSWDGKWLSTLLRAAGRPRHSLRLRDSDQALREAAHSILGPATAENGLRETVEDLIALVEIRQAVAPPVHRALADAVAEHALWLAVQNEARHIASNQQMPGR